MLGGGKLVKLVATVASWFKGVVKARFAPYVAKQKAKADDISNRAALQSFDEGTEKVEKLVQDDSGVTGDVAVVDGKLVLSTHHQGPKRRRNIESVFRKAADRIDKENIDAQAPDRDWTARFFDYVRDVSQEELQEIWARILSGEMEKPGRVSLCTLSILRNMSKADADAYMDAMQYRIGRHIVEFCVKDPEHQQHLVTLLQAGLLYTPFMMGPDITIGKDGRVDFGEHGKSFLVIQGPPGTKLGIPNFSASTLAPAARELLFLCRPQENTKYLRRVAKVLSRKGCKLLSAPITERDPDGKFQYFPGKLREIAPCSRSDP